MAVNHRGYTLIELMVASLVALLVVAVTISVFLTQQRSFASLDLTRVSQDATRNSLMMMEPALRRLGFGIDPRYAVDMQNYRCTTPPCRDRIDGPDELVFVSRNPFYRWSDAGENGCSTTGGCFVGNAWTVTASTATTVTVSANVGDQFVKGRVLQGVCANGSTVTMGTVDTTTPSAPVTAAGTLQIPLVAAVANNAYKENNFTASCFTTAGAAIFLVDRYRFAIVDFNDPIRKATFPWLVLDNGLDVNLNGTTPEGGDADDLIPIAKNVEDLQVAWLLNSSTTYTAPDSNTDWIIGNKSGSREEPNPAASAPLYTTATTDSSRFNLHPANVRGIRLTLTVKSPYQDHTQPDNWAGDSLILSENRNTQPADLGKLRRYRASTSITLRNMDSRSVAIF